MIFLLLLFVPFTPKNAVRLSVLENGHPLAAMLAFPRKMKKQDTGGLSGKHISAYYMIAGRVSSNLGGFESSIVGVKEGTNGAPFYKAELVFEYGP